MTNERKMTDEEVQDTAFAIGVMVTAAELFMEGKLLNEKGEKQITEAMEVIDKYQITDEEIGIYVKEIQKDQKRSTTNFLRHKGVMK